MRKYIVECRSKYEVYRTYEENNRKELMCFAVTYAEAANICSALNMQEYFSVNPEGFIDEYLHNKRWGDHEGA